MEQANAPALWSEEPVGKGQILKYNVHNCLQDIPNQTVQTIAKQLSIPLAVLLLNLDGNMNIAMSIRSAVALCCSDIYIVGKRQYDSRGAVGAKNYIMIHRYKEINPAQFFQENKLLPILIEQVGTPIEEFTFKPYFEEAMQGYKPVIIMGSEGEGIPQEWLSLRLGPRVTIPQMGVLRSLNVSIACSIILYEYMKQWRKYISDKIL
jgi:tRNA (guanosine-2'-O-)-methyltransferase